MVLRVSVVTLKASYAFIALYVLNNASSNAAGAVQALTALGYSQSEAAAVVGKIDSSLKTEEIIRLALKSLAKF